MSRQKLKLKDKKQSNNNSDSARPINMIKTIAQQTAEENEESMDNFGNHANQTGNHSVVNDDVVILDDLVLVPSISNHDSLFGTIISHSCEKTTAELDTLRQRLHVIHQVSGDLQNLSPLPLSPPPKLPKNDIGIQHKVASNAELKPLPKWRKCRERNQVKEYDLFKGIDPTLIQHIMLHRDDESSLSCGGLNGDDPKLIGHLMLHRDDESSVSSRGLNDDNSVSKTEIKQRIHDGNREFCDTRQLELDDRLNNLVHEEYNVVSSRTLGSATFSPTAKRHHKSDCQTIADNFCERGVKNDSSVHKDRAPDQEMMEQPACPLCGMQFAKSMNLVDRDGHIAACFSEAGDDVLL